MTHTKAPVGPVLVIGCGEVGCALIDHLTDQGVSVVAVDPAAPAGRSYPIHPAIGPSLGAFEFIFAAVPSAASIAVARTCAPHLMDATYIDLSSSPRGVMVEAACHLPDGRFVDAAIMGSIAVDGARAPMLLAGGRSDAVAERLQRLDLLVRIVPGGLPGDAGALKLLRSIITKGLEAVAVEGYLAAHQLGLLDALRDNLADVGRGSFPEFLDAMVRTHVGHAARRSYEIEAAVEQLEDLGFDPVASRSVVDRFRRTATANLQSQTMTSRDEALVWMKENTR